MSTATELQPVPPPAAKAPSVAAAQPELPLTIIERSPGWRFIDFGELWKFRELLFFLTWRDVKVRYKQTVLGVAWALLQPLATMIVFTLVFARGAGVQSPDVPYPLFTFTGLLPWTFFATALAGAGQSIVGSQNLVSKIYFPRLIIPTSAVLAALVDLAIASGMLLVMMVWYGVPVQVSILAAPLLVLALTIAALGFGTLLAALTVAYRDFRHIIPFMVQLWLFATPTIMFPTLRVGPIGEWVYPLNPAYGIIKNFRIAILGHQPWDLKALAISTTVSIVFLVVGCLYFRRVERSFADII